MITPRIPLSRGFIGSPSMNFVHGKIGMANGRKSFVSDSGLVLPLPDCAVEEGRPVTYGIRPEHIVIGPEGVPMNVVVVEPTGSETQIFAKSGTDLIDALVKERILARPGSELGFVIDPANVHLFDRKTERRIAV